jgi:uncharacterized protein YgiM (DUF1202 family)
MKEPFRRKTIGVATEDYDSTYTKESLSVQAGETLNLGKPDPEWEGWIWVTNAAGTGGWMPESYLKKGGEQATALRAYSGRELRVHKGDRLTLLKLVSGWFWATDAQGESGWIPASGVDIIVSEPVIEPGD